MRRYGTRGIPKRERDMLSKYEALLRKEKEKGLLLLKMFNHPDTTEDRILKLFRDLRKRGGSDRYSQHEQLRKFFITRHEFDIDKHLNEKGLLWLH